jgi:hypothetical protein
MALDLTSGLLITRKPDDETHGNHLRAPVIGIRDLRLKAAGKRPRMPMATKAKMPMATVTSTREKPRAAAEEESGCLMARKNWSSGPRR